MGPGRGRGREESPGRAPGPVPRSGSRHPSTGWRHPRTGTPPDRAWAAFLSVLCAKRPLSRRFPRAPGSCWRGRGKEPEPRLHSGPSGSLGPQRRRVRLQDALRLLKPGGREAAPCGCLPDVGLQTGGRYAGRPAHRRPPAGEPGPAPPRPCPGCRDRAGERDRRPGARASCLRPACKVNRRLRLVLRVQHLVWLSHSDTWYFKADWPRSS